MVPYSGYKQEWTKIADPDPAFHFNADPDTDPVFHFYMDSDNPPHQSDANLHPLVYRPSRALF
jgi:hypothetical protein